MRTTVTIDDELLRAAKVLAAQTDRTLGSVVEQALAEMLARHDADRPRIEPYRLTTFGSGGLAPGVDLDDKEQIAELLGDNDLLR